MGRNLLSGDLSSDNIDDAKFTKNVDPIDSLRRIGSEWLALGIKCSCETNAGCSVCEIDYILEEAFELPE